MKTVNYFRICFTLGLVAILISCSPTEQESTSKVNNNVYFPPKPQFEFKFPATANAGLIERALEVKYISHNAGNYIEQFPNGTFYNFELPDTGARADLSVPFGVAEDLKAILVPNVIYRITTRVLPGWPFAYGLLITHDGLVDFVGIADSDLNKRHIVIDSSLPASFPSLKIDFASMLIDHYIENVSQFDKLTNYEIKFSLGDSSVVLHQGESSVLGSYKIDLLVAQGQNYKPGILDAGANAFSYTLTRVK